LLKSACRLIYGLQVDVVQTSTILEAIFKQVVAACDVPLRLGAPLLQGLLDRQYDHVAGVQAFISSLKASLFSLTGHVYTAANQTP
jgi:origin recognition complex subunit 3